MAMLQKKISNQLASVVILFSVILSSPFAMGQGIENNNKCITKDNINEYIEEFIKKNPKVITDSLESYYMEEKKIHKKTKENLQKQKIPDITKKIMSDSGYHSIGNPQGKFVIIEFFDYNCGWCKKTNKSFYELFKSKKAPNIRLIQIDTPIFGEKSEIISRYVLAAGKQGKYKEMHNAIITSKQKYDKEQLIKLAKKLHLNVKKLVSDANSDEIKERLKQNITFANEIGVSGVPFLIIDGTANPGALFGERLEEVVKESNK